MMRAGENRERQRGAGEANGHARSPLQSSLSSQFTGVLSLSLSPLSLSQFPTCMFSLLILSTLAPRKAVEAGVWAKSLEEKDEQRQRRTNKHTHTHTLSCLPGANVLALS